MKNHLSALTLLILSFVPVAQEKHRTPSLDTLLSQVDSLLAESNNPALAVSIVRGDSILFAGSLGIKNRETQAPAGDSTLFRIGSISKMFVALSILKLQEEGKISLKDKLKDWAPEIEYQNPWTETNPILIEHLLEHTTGWDDIHLPEYAQARKEPISLKQGLDFHPHSRTSRWVPGTRFSYCNSGPPVAAFIVQKITGKTFEAYVQEEFFDPIGMHTASYFEDSYQKKGATLYEGTEPQTYEHIIMRPSGSINATALDMAKMVQFFVRDAKVDSSQLISKQSLKRMETPTTSIGAQAGVEAGYGLNNFSSTQNGFPFQGHNGGVSGGSSELAYNRNVGIGFAIMVNSSNSTFRSKISDLIATFLTNELKRPSKSIEAISTKAFDGYYYAINPRQQLNFFATRLFNIKKIWSDDSLIYFANYPSEKPRTYRAISDSLAYGENGKISLVITKDPLVGRVVSGSNAVFAPTSYLAVWASWIFIGVWITGLLVAGVWMLVSFIRLLSGNEKLAFKHLLQIGPALIFICLFMAFVFMGYGSQDPYLYLASPTPVAKTIYLSSLLLGIFSLFWVALSIGLFFKVNRGPTYWFFATLSLASLFAALYLWDHGAIGLQTWA